ncbi:copper radical oxidase [Auriscalpium vulgare]|uniref:Copper radical oxidase n=1 Tax=Auriscalpium vulgare TaxID=40419 RepID=A0ACB8SA73_9AGAM|nr:copper radical oxidase [Auriscalpium vulgare]
MRSILLPFSLALVIPFILASHVPVHHYNHFHRRQTNIFPPPTDLPGNWSSAGCYTDNPATRTLSSASFTDTQNMTVENCVTFCDNQAFIFAGVEFAQECYCGDIIANGGTNATASDCNSPCTGNSKEDCGAGGRLNLYWSGKQPPPPPITDPSNGLWVSLGCYNDTAASRVLNFPTNVAGGASNNSVQSCTDACFNSGYPLSGMEFADECYCALAITNGGVSEPAADCSMPCSGNSSEFCGGPNRLNVYNYTGTDLPPVTNPGGGGGGNPGTPVFPVTSGLPTPWNYSACYVDNAFGRIFSTELPDNQNVTVESCVQSCASQNFTLAGLEFSVQCFCGDTLVDGAVSTKDADCNMGCGGNTTEACGGPNRLSVYTATGNVTALPVPVVQLTTLPGQWQYSGCLAEPGAARVFPYQIINTNNNSAAGCLAQCSAFGYPAAGMEFGDECWCGDVDDITNNGGKTAPETDCVIPCSGDPIHLCGGAERLQLYLWNGTIDVWNTPTNIGRYEYLIPGLVPPLVATVGINGKVSFLEKGGTSEFTNSTGAYELDLSLVDNFDLAWREMHLKTDVFCSAAVVLPDKAARILNIGGWSLDSTFGVRLYAPDGVPGVNGTNDWEENVSELSLQNGRWYPTAMVMSNGSILVVGGESGSNAPPVPTLEILPRIPGGDTTKFLDYLNRTDPNNLYPFLVTLPSGNIFIGYYNEARILNPVTFDTIKVLPNMPGSVTSFLAGRTYPMEGAAVILPQSPPYTAPVTILVCGGSNFGIALDNCVSIQPEAKTPTWVVERMPSARVMSCMVALPDGTFMIMNGAQQGVAGFGLADDPNLSALLYDPSRPVHNRISILNTTTIARLYHSEATLLPDGRVLISGSDPQTLNADGTPKFPEELRIEVYIPPYLNQGFVPPSFNISNTDWTYGSKYQITVKLHQGTTSNMKVSLVAATSSTHGNTMGGRTIFPTFSCSGTTCTITAPPNASVSPPGWHQLFVLDGPTPSSSHWVRIGGDPAKLGNWPQFPDFTLPGV